MHVTTVHRMNQEFCGSGTVVLWASTPISVPPAAATPALQVITLSVESATTEIVPGYGDEPSIPEVHTRCLPACLIWALRRGPYAVIEFSVAGTPPADIYGDVVSTQ